MSPVDPFDELGLETPIVRRRDLREPSTRRSRRAGRRRLRALGAAEGRRPESARRHAGPAARTPAVPRTPVIKRITTKLVPVVALGFAAALFIGTSIPASAFSTSNDSATAPAPVKPSATIAGQSLHAAADSTTPVARDSFEATSEQQLAQIQEVGAAAGYTVNNSGPIRWPFDNPVLIASPFGPRVAPCSGCSTFHHGTDFATGGGASIYAVAAGVVTASDYGGTLGQHVAIEHTVNGKTFTSVYGHMEAGSSPMVVGETIAEGALVGLTGSTGESTGPHLYVEIDVDGTPIDSFVWLKANTAH